MKISQISKIVLLLIALGGVIYAMRLLQSPTTTEQLSGPDNPIAALLGSDLRPMNWCPSATKEIEVPAKDRHYGTASDVSRFCEVMIEPVTQGDVRVEDYQVVALAVGEGKTKKLEKNSKGVFRVEGFPFHSKQLEKQFY